MSSAPVTSDAALALYRDAEVFDLHNDLYVPARLYGFNVFKRHQPGLFGSRFFNQTDFVRLREATMSGLTFDIATNPSRRRSRRADVALANIARVKADLARVDSEFAFVKNHREYQAARARGLTACYIGIQGGQAFQHSADTLDAIPEDVHRITLVHLTNSQIGSTSSPLGAPGSGKRPLSNRGLELVEVMNHKRVLVDLAHINRAGFVAAADAHDKTQPLIVTHTGVSAVHAHWRNIDDEQIRMVADTGGCIGVIFASIFLAKTPLPLMRCAATAVVDHLEHIINVGGEGAPAIGTDYDGLIIPPIELQQVTDMPYLVQLMLDRKWSEQRIRNVLGGNVTRVLEAIRP